MLYLASIVTILFSWQISIMPRQIMF